MKTTVEELDDNRVKLSIEVEADEFDGEVEKAFKKIARDVRLPGFRKGKVPRKVLEARFGTGVARGQALEDSLPDYFLKALGEHEIDMVSPPEYELTSGEEDGDVAFDAVVHVRPKATITDYHALTIEVPAVEPTDEEVAERVDDFLGQFAELAEADRPAIDGDTVTVDIATTHDGEPLDALTADDYQYRVGSGGLVPELDANLTGAKVGDILEFDADHPAPDEDGELSFRLLVKQVQQQVLPELTDEVVAGASDFETVDDFRADIVERLREDRISRGHDLWHSESVRQLGELIEVDLPAPMIDAEARRQVEGMARQLAQSGVEFQTFLEISGQSIDQVLDNAREPAANAARQDIALRALAEAEGLVATDDDITAEFESWSEMTNTPVEDLRERISTPNELMLMRDDISVRKAGEWLLDHVAVIDEDGNAVDTSLFHHDHDERHTHDGAQAHEEE